MASKSNTYKLEYFKQGTYYSAASEYRRFVTLDYNLNSYVGIVGVGILSGWTIEHTSGLNVQILPGNGIINGFFSESPYTLKKRSSMVAGDREVEVINENQTVYLPLTAPQRTQYISVIQLYNPSYDPPAVILDEYVKVVVPSVLALTNNTDNYIYARRPTGSKPYPKLDDLQALINALPPQPLRKNYPDFPSYQIASNAYKAQIAAIHTYQWQTNSDNHFTIVEFSVSENYTNNSTNILLGKVVTRSGIVTKIDLSMVDNLQNMETQVKSYAEEYISAHHHGGNLSYDPPKIRLETDIRDTVLYNYNKENGRCTFQVLDRYETSIILGHKHTYQVDADGNGQTMEMLGSGNFHIHNIAAFVLSEPLHTLATVDAHIHTIKNPDVADTWTEDSRFIVYLNGKVFGDQTSSYIQANVSKKQITITRGVSTVQNKYGINIDFSLMSYGLNEGNAEEPVTFKYEAKNTSIFNFMLNASAAYFDEFSTFYDVVEYDIGEGKTASNDGVVSTNIQRNPFICYDSEGNIYGSDALRSQSAAAQTALEDVGDTFLFVPNAAQNIPVTLLEKGTIATDVVTIEILGQTEVTGKLQPENILFVNANKITLGEFIPEVIPFISHIGRFREEFLPLQYTLTSIDAIRYMVVPTITDSNLLHSHRLLLNEQMEGITNNTLVANEPVYYESDNFNNTYFIYHSHVVSNGVVESANSTGLQYWNNSVSGNVTSSVHVHNVIIPVIGNDKTIYSIKEDINGNVYAGTSDGFLMIPSAPSYLFVINGFEFYFYGNNLWQLLLKAKSQYEKDTDNTLVITEEIYGKQVAEASEELVSVGDSYLLTGQSSPDRPVDEIMLKRISSFKMPNFGYTTERKSYEILRSEKIVKVIPSATEENEDTTFVVVNDFNNVPIWSLVSETVINPAISYVTSFPTTNLVVVGSNLISKGVGTQDSPYQIWNAVTIPFSAGIIRKIIKDRSGNYWVCTDSGLMVSRSYNQGNIFDFVTLPGANPNIMDIAEGEKGYIYSVSSSGIFKTINGGKTWNKIFDVAGGFKQIVRDRSIDKTMVNQNPAINQGHYHNLNINIEGNGYTGEAIGTTIKHVHKVTSWQIEIAEGHVHEFMVTLYAVSNSKTIWKSENNGKTWHQYGLLPDGECGDIFASFNKIFVSQSDGLHISLNGTTWTKTLNARVYSYEWSYDMSEVFLGCDNIIYSTFDGDDFDVVYELDGLPAAILLDNGTRQYFGYAYDNYSATFHFKESVTSDKMITALVDFERWYADNGVWENSNAYDVYINNKWVFSTKYDRDKRVEYGYSFTADPLDGLLNFEAVSNLASNANAFSSTILVDDASKFYAGDKIVISAANASSVYASIDAISSNEIVLDSITTKPLNTSYTVRRISNLDGGSTIMCNIYNSLLSNIGNLTHEQVEDGLDDKYDGRPYKFNDVYLSNLLQLTQAARYVYPDINSEFKNSVFYDMHYSTSPSDPIYPHIDDYIDLLTSETYNQKVYDNNFVGMGAKFINKILIGFGSFDGYIYVATDIGLFWAKLESNYEANWFYVNDLSFGIYDLMIFGTDRLYAATQEGTYYTTDMKIWIKESSPMLAYPSYSLGLRWADQPVTNITAHTASFVSDSANNAGTITSMIVSQYASLEENQSIAITNAGTKNGSYIITSISNNASILTVSPSFSGIDETVSGVEMVMGSWWQQWNGEINTLNQNLTNTLLVGGENKISFNDGGVNWAWYESSYDISNFMSKQFLSLTNGRLLLTASGTTTLDQKNYLMKSDDIGKNWTTFKEFNQIPGKINSVSVSDFNNSVLTVSFDEEYVYEKDNLDQCNITISSPSQSTVLNGKIVGNEKRDGLDKITVYSNGAYSFVGDLSDCTFVVSPLKVNALTETNMGTLFFGTDKGIYYDVNTVVNNINIEGSIIGVGYTGTVSAIDISGTIISIINNNNQVRLSITADANIRGNDLVNQNLYVTDANPVEKYKIMANSSASAGDESIILIDATYPLSSIYVGKRIKIVGPRSRIYIDYASSVNNNQFNNGTFYITSTDQYGNKGKSYGINNNTTEYIEINEAWTPASTLIDRNTTTTTTLRPWWMGDEYGNIYQTERNNTWYDTVNKQLDFAAMEQAKVLRLKTANDSLVPLQVGQTIMMFDSTNRLTTWVTLDTTVKENALNDLSMKLTASTEESALGNIAISSNLKNSIVLEIDNFYSSENNTIDIDKVLLIHKSDTFVIKGAMFNQLGGFSHLKTSVDSGHYHDVETVNAIVSGSIQSLTASGSSYIHIVVSNTQNFNIPIVQLRGNLFYDAQIVFTTPNNISLRYISEVIEHDASSITVRLKSSSYWNAVSPDNFKVSKGWNWEIDATNYGYTDGITYDDFVVATKGVTTTINRNSDLINLENVVNINVGDKIKIQDDTISYEIGYVKQIIDSNTIKLLSAVTRTFFISKNPQIKVLRDTFSNIHVHQIRNNEVEVINVSEYLDNGYSISHSHRVLPLISDVSVLLNRNEETIAMGSDNIIYNTIDNGLSWNELVDFNDFKEGYEDVTGVSAGILNSDNKLVVGATNGSLFAEIDNKNGIIKL